jgi:4-hydroxybenzoate polyprenyltransferase
MTRIKPYLQLVRLPNLFTAAADSLAGWLIVRGSLESPGRWLPLVLASVAIYAAGIVLNDVFDYEVDLRERPNRPLPSGRVSRRFAAWFGGISLAMGPILASFSGSTTSLIVAVVLAGCVLAYDAGLKRTVLGPEAMGACRGLNLLLGLSQGPEMGGPAAWLVAVGLGLFIVGVTWISRSEVETGKTRGLVAGLGLQGMALIALLAACSRPGWFRSIDPASPIVGSSAAGLLVLLAVGFLTIRAGVIAYRRPVPETFQRAVKTGVLSLVWLDVAAVAAVRGPSTALVVAALWVPAFLLGKWLYST